MLPSAQTKTDTKTVIFITTTLIKLYLKHTLKKRPLPPPPPPPPPSRNMYVIKTTHKTIKHPFYCIKCIFLFSHLIAR